MKTSRLKNIVILILTLLNLFLLLLLADRYITAKRVADRTQAQLLELYSSGGIALDAQLLPAPSTLTVYTPQRDIEAERAFAEQLLGSAVSVDSGGGTYRYYAPGSSCLFRSSGAFESVPAREVADPAAFCEELLAPLGYAVSAQETSAQRSVFTAVRYVDGIPVTNCTMHLVFSENYLIDVNGTFLPATLTAAGTAATDPVSALVRFFDYRNSSGAVCTQITGIFDAYLLQSDGSGTPYLTAVTGIETDAYSYYVNSSTGEVLRAS